MASLNYSIHFFETYFSKTVAYRFKKRKAIVIKRKIKVNISGLKRPADGKFNSAAFAW